MDLVRKLANDANIDNSDNSEERESAPQSRVVQICNRLNKTCFLIAALIVYLILQIIDKLKNETILKILNMLRKLQEKNSNSSDNYHEKIV